ncbi:MAG: ribulose-phosphate 3-epimerase [Phycisphaerae bacterium]
MESILQTQVPIISVGVLTADWMSLNAELSILENAGIRFLHIDVMDGVFCPMMTMGPPVIKAIKTTLFKDVHLMIENPLDKLESFVAAGADMITIHVENNPHCHRVLQVLGKMKNVNDPNRGIVRGIALNPGTPLETISPLLDEVDMIFLLAVNPGWGGQKFIASTFGRIKLVQEMIRKNNRKIFVGLDGGITRDNIAQAAGTGADVIVTGSAVFDGKDPAGNARFILGAIRQYRSKT